MTEHQRELNNAIAHELDMADRSCAPLRAEHIRFALWFDELYLARYGVQSPSAARLDKWLEARDAT